eukprot:7385589-Prymnesium_polylepis.1
MARHVRLRHSSAAQRHDWAAAAALRRRCPRCGAPRLRLRVLARAQERLRQLVAVVRAGLEGKRVSRAADGFGVSARLGQDLGEIGVGCSGARAEPERRLAARDRARRVREVVPTQLVMCIRKHAPKRLAPWLQRKRLLQRLGGREHLVRSGAALRIVSARKLEPAAGKAGSECERALHLLGGRRQLACGDEDAAKHPVARGGSVGAGCRAKSNERTAFGLHELTLTNECGSALVQRGLLARRRTLQQELAARAGVGCGSGHRRRGHHAIK